MKAPEIGLLILSGMVCLFALILVWRMIGTVQTLTGRVARSENKRSKDLDDQLFRFLEKTQMLPKDSAFMHAKERYNRDKLDAELEKTALTQEGSDGAKNPSTAHSSDIDVNE